MTSHPALQRALVKWSATNPNGYNATIWQLAAAAMQVLRPNGQESAGERQALFLAFDRILCGPEEKRKQR